MPTLDQRIKEESAKVKAESYQKVASIGGWSGAGRTLWALGTVGAIVGATIGLIAPLFPLLAIGITAATWQTAVAAIPISVAAFAATGMSTGFGGGIMLGRISGTSAAVAQEQEKRMKEWMVRQKIADNPQAEILPDAPQTAAPQKPFWQRVKDTYLTYVNPRVGLAMAVVGAIGGLIMAAAFIYTGGVAGFAIAPALGTLTGLGEAAVASATATAAATTTLTTVQWGIMAYSAGIMASFGAILGGLNSTKITSAVTHFFGELGSGKLLGRTWGPKEPEKLRSASQVTYDQDITISGNGNGKSQNSSRSFASFQDLVASRETNSPELSPKR